MLKMALVQHAQYSHSLDQLHSTPQASHTRSRHEDFPAVTSGPRRLSQHDSLGMPDTRAQDIVDAARAARHVEPTVAAGQAYPAYITTPPTPLDGGGKHIGVSCLTPALRNERKLKDFKGPRKVPNYSPDLEPGSWIESYELAMDMLGVAAVCAKYFTMMLEGATHVAEKPAVTPSTLGGLKECFIKNFRGTCKRPMTIVNLQHYIQRPDESAHHWTRRVAEVIHSSKGISAAQAVLILEKNCHYEPLVLKLGRLKQKVQDMGELMDPLTTYAESDDTKDPGEGDDKTGAAKKGELHKGQSQFQNRGNNHHDGYGKKRQQEGPTEFVDNTNTGNKNPRQKKQGFSGKKPRNYHKMLKGPFPQHATTKGPATHSWEDCYVMQEFWAEALKRSQSGEKGHGGTTRASGPPVTLKVSLTKDHRAGRSTMLAIPSS
ncbi:hypothetical protein ZWY2020_002108 [Hordeum vulgare]|nr:hypothetical protein ZWY2020_002108 [Hordeum vulgare]